MDVGLNSSPKTVEWNFFVEGVRCSKCVHKLEGLPLQHPELTDSRFNQSRRVLTLSSEQTLSPESAITWIQKLGYKAYFVETSQKTEAARQRSHRQWLIRLAVTFFFASNLMMFAIALYTGAYGPWKALFGWFCGILFLPIAFYSAIPFYKSAWQSLKEGRFSADVAIVIAFGWGSLLSYVNLVRGLNDFYFDSTASFLFLILLARFLLDKAQNSIESDLNPSLLFKEHPLFERKNSKGQIEKIYFHQILKGDSLFLNIGQTIPVDVRLQSLEAEINTALFSGESLPRTFHQGNLIKAGMIVQSQPIQAEAMGPFSESELHQIFEGVIRNRHEKTRSHAQAEIYSQRLLTTVSILSVLVLIFFGVHAHWSEGFRRALALFTIACPCALALAIPLASVVTLKRAMEEGLFVKSPLFFERLRDITGVLFDKTGTLTMGELTVHSWEPEQPPLEDLQILLALEEKSQHPIAQSITRFLQSQKIRSIPLEQWEEIPGFGIRATYQGIPYEVRRRTNGPLSTLTTASNLSSNANLSGFELRRKDQILLRAYLKDQIRPEAQTLIKALKKKNLDLFILSGDRPEVVTALAVELGLNIHNCRAEMSPQDKAEFLTAPSESPSPRYLMVGDGHNDALALSKSSTSLAVKGSAETSLRAADAYSQKNDLRIILTALKLSTFYHRLIRQNVGLSLTYNLLAGSMAIAGLVDPLMAAVLMPLNSFVVIGATVLAHPTKTKEI